MENRLVSALTRAIFDTQLVSARLSLCVAEFIWFIMLAYPGDTFDRPIYSGMKHIMPEDCWLAVFLISAAIQFWIIVSENFYGIFARVFSFFNALLWISIVFLTLASSSQVLPAAMAGNIALAISAIWIWVQPKILYRGICHARSTPG